MLQAFTFDAVVVDEAAQAVETSTLIPLRYNPQAVVLVGDPAQLPATVLSREAQAGGLGGSLFERLQEGGFPRCFFLDTQYRMHPKIARIVSSMFYTEKGLKTAETGAYHPPPWFDFKLSVVPTGGQDASKRVNVRFWLAAESRDRRKAAEEEPSGPLVFHNVQYGTMAGSTAPSCHGSWTNASEAEFVVRLYKRLEDLMFRRFWLRGKLDAPASKAAHHGVADGRMSGEGQRPKKRISDATSAELAAFQKLWAVGIIAPYRGQAFELRKGFRERNVRIPEDVEVSTVDGFQGREKDLIILTTTRAPLASRARSDAAGVEIDDDTYLQGIGFLKDRRRLNVAISRAKHSLWIVGHAHTLTQNEDWDTLLKADGMCLVDYTDRPWSRSDAKRHPPGPSKQSMVERRAPSPADAPQVPWRRPGNSDVGALASLEPPQRRSRASSVSSRVSDASSSNATMKGKKRKKKSGSKSRSRSPSPKNFATVAEDDPASGPLPDKPGAADGESTSAAATGGDPKQAGANELVAGQKVLPKDATAAAAAVLSAGAKPPDGSNGDVECRPS